jgi:L-ascorbate metabolism protein UlaG (beta-lactamase superfamily)
MSPLTSSSKILEYNKLVIERIGHAAFRIAGDKIVYIDPFNISSSQRADIILITHSHYDHCSIADIRRIVREDTLVICPPDCSSKLSKIDTKCTLKIMAPMQKLAVGQITIESVPAYNINKPYHPKGHEWLGFIVTMAGTRIYHAGDTDFIPEMKKIQADITLLPVGGTYTMDAAEAASAANMIRPQIAIPMHYGDIVGTHKDAESFRQLCKVKVVLLE